MSNKKEINSLTGLRGIASTAVMFYHFNASHLMSGYSANMMGHGYLMVDLFLILSGFILALTYGKRFSDTIQWYDCKVFFVRRIARIYPIYFLMTITAGLLIATRWMDHWPGPPIWMSGLINFTMLQSVLHVPSLDTPAWSVSAEWIANLFFPVLAFICLRRNVLIALLLAVFSFITLYVLIQLPVLMHEPKRAGLLDIWNYETIFPAIRCFVDFIIGIVIFRIWQYEFVQKLFSLVWVAPLFLLLTLFFMTIKNADFVIMTLFAFFILSLISQNNPVSFVIGSKPIHRLGEISFSVYLIHNQMNYFMLALARYLESKGMSFTMSNAFSIVIFVILVVFLADLFYRFIEKPARNAINNFVVVKQTVPSYSALDRS